MAIATCSSALNDRALCTSNSLARYDEFTCVGRRWISSAIRRSGLEGPQCRRSLAWRMMAVSKALGCNPTLADKAAKKALELDPSARVSLLALQIPLRALGGP